MKPLPPLLLAAFAAGCAPSQQALLTSGGASDFKAMQWVAEEYGTGEPDAVIQIPVDGRDKPFKVFASKKNPRVMVQNGLSSEIAGAAFTRGLTAGISNSDPPDKQPYAAAARAFLAGQHGGAECKLFLFSPVARIGYDWTYECAPPPAAGRSRRQ